MDQTSTGKPPDKPGFFASASGFFGLKGNPDSANPVKDVRKDRTEDDGEDFADKPGFFASASGFFGLTGNANPVEDVRKDRTEDDDEDFAEDPTEKANDSEEDDDSDEEEDDSYEGSKKGDKSDDDDSDFDDEDPPKKSDDCKEDAKADDVRDERSKNDDKTDDGDNKDRDDGSKKDDGSRDNEDEAIGDNSFIVVDGKFPEIDRAGKTVINNTFGCLGPVLPKKGTIEHRSTEVNKVQNTLLTAGILTGNDVWTVACPFNRQKIEDFSLAERDYQIPPIKMQGNMIHNIFHDYCLSALDEYMEKEKAEFNSIVNGHAIHQSFPSREKFSLWLGNGIRYYSSYWYLHPTLTRKEAYEAAKGLLEEKATHGTKKVVHKTVLSEVLKEKIQAETLKQLLLLKTESMTVEGSEIVCFDAKSNKKADDRIQWFLHAMEYKFEWADYPLGAVDVLKGYIDQLPDNHDQKARLSKFAGIAHRQTEEFKNLQLSIENAKKKKDENAEKKKEKAEKAKEKRQQALEKQREVLRSTPQEVPTHHGRGVKRQSDNIQLASSLPEFVSTQLPGLPLSFSGKITEAIAPENGPIRLYDDVGEKCATVSYQLPGSAFCEALKLRFSSMRSFLNVMDAMEPDLMKIVWAKAGAAEDAKHSANWLSDHAVEATVAAFMSAEGKLKVKNSLVDETYVRLLEDGREFTNFCKDVKSLSTTLINPASLDSFPFVMTAFGLLVKNEKTWGNGKKSSKKITRAEAKLAVQKVLVSDMEFTEPVIEKLMEIMLAVEMLSKREDHAGDILPYAPFELKLECIIPKKLFKEKKRTKKTGKS